MEKGNEIQNDIVVLLLTNQLNKSGIGTPTSMGALIQIYTSMLENILWEWSIPESID
jgi:hypothetical protein